MTIKISQLANLTSASDTTFMPVVDYVFGTLTTLQANVGTLRTYFVSNVSASVAVNSANISVIFGNLGNVARQFSNVSNQINLINANVANTNAGLTSTNSNLASTNSNIAAINAALANVATYGNVNVAAYLNTQGYNLYSNVNVIAYLAGSITTGAITSTAGYNIAGNIISTGAIHNNVVVNSGNVNAVGGYFVGNGYFLTGIITNLTGGLYSNVNTAAYLATGTITVNTLIANGNVVGGLSQFAAINNTAIGNSSPSTGIFTTLSATGNVIGGLGQFAAINSTPIGNATPALGVFTSIGVVSNITGGLTQLAALNNTPIGNALPNTGAFTTLTTSGAVAVNGNVTTGGYLFSNATGGSGTLTNQTGLAPAYQYYAMNGNLLVPNGTGDQRIFNANVFLAASTVYEFEVAFAVFRNITAVASTSLQFNLGQNLTGVTTTNWVNYNFFTGNASPGSYGGEIFGANFTGNTVAGWANVLSNVTFTNASTASASDIWALVKGTIVTSTAGWVSPRIAYTAAPGGVSYVQGGSYMKIAAVGIGSSGAANVSIGTWAA